MADFTDYAENLVINFILDNAVTQPTGPLQLALTSTVPTDSTPGTEMTGGGYTREDITFGSVSGGAVSNSAVIRFDNLSGTDVAGVEVWDSTPVTPVRLLWKAYSKTIDPGDSLEIPIGDLDFIVA